MQRPVELPQRGSGIRRHSSDAGQVVHSLITGRNTVHGVFGLLLALGLVYYFTYQHTRFTYDPNGPSRAVDLLPGPSVLWYTGTWLLTAAILWALITVRGPLSLASNDRAMRGAAILAVAGVYAWEAASRLIAVGAFGLERLLNVPMLLGGAGVAGVLLYALLRWLPTAPILAAMMVAWGILVRIAWFATVGLNPDYSDNLSAIEGGLDRLMSGRTPYAMLDFGTHTNPMQYLPWTFLSYIPPHLLGLDIRATNLVLSLATIVLLWLFLGPLRIPVIARNALLLILGLYFVLPRNIGHDGFTEFQMFNLALTATFCLVALGRERLAAAAYGVALGAMPLALFVAPALVAYACRTYPLRRVAFMMATTVVVGSLPVIPFLMWDAGAFFEAASFSALEAWQIVDMVRGNMSLQAPTYAIWHIVLGSGLRFVQIALTILVVATCFRAQPTVRGVLTLSIASYVLFVLSGPKIGSHMFQVLLYLAVIASGLAAAEGLRRDQAARAASPRSATAAPAAPGSPRYAREP
jgi:hypothetical protein